MKVVIPVAGAGTRLRPHTHATPKPLLHVAGKPIIDHLLDPILKLDPDEVILIVGFLGEMIKEHVRANYSFKSTFINQNELLGLGYALNLGVREIDSGDVLILLGDTIVECDLKDFIAAGDNVIGLRQVDDPQRFGIAVIKDGRVVQLEEKPEKPKTNLAVIGLYYFKDVAPLKVALNDHVESGKMTRGEIQLTDALQSMIEAGHTFVPFEVKEWFDCGKRETMLSTNRHLVAAQKQSPQLEGSIAIPPVFIHPEARVERSVLGPNVSISEGAVIRSCILRDTIVGEKAVVENMILEDSLISSNTRLTGTRHKVNLGDSSEIYSHHKEH